MHVIPRRSAVLPRGLALLALEDASQALDLARGKVGLLEEVHDGRGRRAVEDARQERSALAPHARLPIDLGAIEIAAPFGGELDRALLHQPAQQRLDRA